MSELPEGSEPRPVTDASSDAPLRAQPGDPAAAASDRESFTEEDVEKLRAMIGGKAGIMDGAVPALLFVVANAIWGLNVGAAAAAAYGVGTVAYRSWKRQPIRHALIGLGGLLLSVGIALITRNPTAYFVPGTALGALAGLAYLVTVVVKQPTSAMLAMAIERKPQSYYRRPEVLRMHMIVTTIWGLAFIGRAALRSWLIVNDQTELLGASTLVLGYPLTATLIGGSVLYLRRGARRIPDDPAPDEPA